MAKPMLAVLLIGSSLSARDSQSEKRPIAAPERRELLRRAQVWTPTDVAANDIRRGPADRAFEPGAVVDCDFSPKEFGGRTPKFGCAIGAAEVLKVRYGRDNGEIYAGVAATRLLWALGFGTDAMYPVQVRCHGCPQALAPPGVAMPAGIRFDVAAIERKFPGRDVSGWSWKELDLVDPSVGGASVAQVDALKLMAVLLQHSDNKPDQQRLLCRRDGASKNEERSECDPFLMIHDVGVTFGQANLWNRGSVGSVNLDRWSRTPIWKDPARCVGNLARSATGTLSNPVISEPGRAFLSGLLARLTDQQLTDLFSVALFTDRPRGGGPVDAWVAAFKHKRDEIASVRCR